MILVYFLKGIAIGFAMSVPIGPISIMCIRRTLNEGQLQGLVIGLGASAGDMLYSCVAAFGLTVVSNVLIAERIWIRLVGGVLLLFLGIKAYRAQPADPKLQVQRTGMLKSFLTSGILALTNPLSIFVFLGLFATFGLEKESSHLTASMLVAGVFLGSIIWFVVLTSGIRIFRKKFNMTKLKLANKIAGILLIISAVAAVGSLF